VCIGAIHVDAWLECGQSEGTWRWFLTPWRTQKTVALVWTVSPLAMCCRSVSTHAWRSHPLRSNWTRPSRWCFTVIKTANLQTAAVFGPQLGKVVPLLCYLSITPWRCMSEWMYRSTFSSPRHLLEVSDHLYTPAALPPGKQPSVPIGQEQNARNLSYTKCHLPYFCWS
jgi:hypothetical protein